LAALIASSFSSWALRSSSCCFS
jgi:hypothetical protein